MGAAGRQKNGPEPAHCDAWGVECTAWKTRFGLAPGGAASWIGGRTGRVSEKLGRVHRLNCGWQARVIQDNLFWTAMARESA